MVQARREVSELVSSMVEAGGALPLPEDRLLTIMEAAQVLIHFFLFLLCSLLQLFPLKISTTTNIKELSHSHALLLLPFVTDALLNKSSKSLQ